MRMELVYRSKRIQTNLTETDVELFINLIDPLQLDQGRLWHKPNKELISFTMVISFVCLLRLSASLALSADWWFCIKGLSAQFGIVVWPWPNFTETKEMYYSLLRRVSKMISFALFLEPRLKPSTNFMTSQYRSMKAKFFEIHFITHEVAMRQLHQKMA